MCNWWFGSASAAVISSRVNCPVRIGSSPLMPCAASPSAIAFTSSGCRLQSCAIWSNDSEVFSTSHTAVAFGIRGAVAIGKSPLRSARLLGEALNVIKDDWKGDLNIGGAGRRCNRPEFLGSWGMAGERATGYLLEFWRQMARNKRKKAWPLASDFGQAPHWQSCFLAPM